MSDQLPELPLTREEIEEIGGCYISTDGKVLDDVCKQAKLAIALRELCERQQKRIEFLEKVYDELPDSQKNVAVFVLSKEEYEHAVSEGGMKQFIKEFEKLRELCEGQQKAIVRYLVTHAPHMAESWVEFLMEEFSIEQDGCGQFRAMKATEGGGK